MITQVWSDFLYWWPYVAGYAYALVLGQVVIRRSVCGLYDALFWESNAQADERKGLMKAAWLSSLVGSVDRVLYVTSFHVGHLEFIGVWIALKVASKWKRWQEDNRVEGRSLFNVHLIGSSLSIMYALLGAKLTDWIYQREWLLCSLPFALCAATWFIKDWASWAAKRWREKQEQHHKQATQEHSETGEADSQ